MSDPNSIKKNNSKDDTFSVISTPEGVKLKCNKKEMVKIYSLTGNLVYNAELKEGDHFIELPKSEYVINNRIVSIR